MRIIDILNEKDETLSFEVFPPKKESTFECVWETTDKIAKIKPDFMSVTYGADGGASEYTIAIAKKVQEVDKIPMLAHLTCVGSTKESLREKIAIMKASGIESILALRGDITDDRGPVDYLHAVDLVRELRDEFCVGGACYPEVHPESSSEKEDLQHLKEKVDEGCQFLTTQMFFDNEIFYRFADKARNIGIQVPLVAGIMPVTNIKQIEKVVLLSGSYLPKKFLDMVEKYKGSPEDMKKAGTEYALNQILDLKNNGAGHIHVYTMNRPSVAEEIWKKLY